VGGWGGGGGARRAWGGESTRLCEPDLRVVCGARDLEGGRGEGASPPKRAQDTHAPAREWRDASEYRETPLRDNTMQLWLMLESAPWLLAPVILWGKDAQDIHVICDLLGSARRRILYTEAVPGGGAEPVGP